MTYATDSMRRDLERHRIEVVQDDERLRCFWLREPGEWCMSVLVTELPSRQIALTGDLTFGGRNGIVSDRGYGLGWFGGRLGEDYLCEKFLSEKWSRERAAKWCRWHRDDIKYDADQFETWKALCEIERDLTQWEEIRTPEELYDALIPIGMADGDVPGYGYDENHAGWLCAVQQRFRECWQQMAEEAA
ncbi:MAG TPA: hypothetical protein VMZ50_09435 [Phycisphaerae bacterium]|nr:hypothetical protein [Phycisphaerae bacterium]